MNNIIIRPLELNYIDDVLKINASSFRTSWQKTSFIKELQNKFAKYIVAIENDTIIAYAGIWIIAGEAHIISIAVSPDNRGNGVSNLLMEKIIDICKKHAVYGITLEVRVSNLPAINLYKKFGFLQEGIRKFYYPDNEDASIMWKRDLKN